MECREERRNRERGGRTLDGKHVAHSHSLQAVELRWTAVMPLLAEWLAGGTPLSGPRHPCTANNNLLCAVHTRLPLGLSMPIKSNVLHNRSGKRTHLLLVGAHLLPLTNAVLNVQCRAQYPYTGTSLMLPLRPSTGYTVEIMVMGGQVRGARPKPRS